MISSTDAAAGNAPLSLQEGGSSLRWLRSKPARYVLAATGPISASATNFLLSVAMLRLLEPSAFGRFTFLLIASQLSWGVWGALFCAPLPVFLSRGSAEEWSAGEETLLAANLAGALLSLPLFAAIAMMLGLSGTVSACFAVYGGIALLRWFARAHAYVHGRQIRTMCSDMIYSTVVLMTVASAAIAFRLEPDTACYMGLLLGAVAGLLPFGADYFRQQTRAIGVASLRRYVSIWVSQSRWALLGVITTEATANAHIYLITLTHGTAAIAPIAASALLTRPVNVAQSALAEFEKPRLARLIARLDLGEIADSQRYFLFALGAIWFGVVIFTIVLFSTNPYFLFGRSYDLTHLKIGAALWLIVAALRFLQIPQGTVLGAAGEFRILAIASVWSSCVSIAVVGASAYLFDPIWSIVGVLSGAVVLLAITWKKRDSWH